jgi:hypothetical protein
MTEANEEEQIVPITVTNLNDILYHLNGFMKLMGCGNGGKE